MSDDLAVYSFLSASGPTENMKSKSAAGAVK